MSRKASNGCSYQKHQVSPASTQILFEIQPDGWNNSYLQAPNRSGFDHCKDVTSRLRSNTVTNNNGNGGNIGGNDKKRLSARFKRPPPPRITYATTTNPSVNSTRRHCRDALFLAANPPLRQQHHTRPGNRNGRGRRFRKTHCQAIEEEYAVFPVSRQGRDPSLLQSHLPRSRSGWAWKKCAKSSFSIPPSTARTKKRCPGTIGRTVWRKYLNQYYRDRGGGDGGAESRCGWWWWRWCWC
jgi:hypothetical protein